MKIRDTWPKNLENIELGNEHWQLKIKLEKNCDFCATLGGKVAYI
jgi:hypothetical protein